jgi:osmotically-inducible protein OsmY
MPEPKMQIVPITRGGNLSELAERKLRESPYFFLRTLRCYCEDGVLTLRGRVPYRQLRQFAESIVSRVDGVREVINRVEIFDPVVEANGAPVVRTAG